MPVSVPEPESEAARAELGQALRQPGVKPRAKRAARPKSRLRIPAVLLEGDEAAPPPVTGPGQKYALGPTAPPTPSGREEAALPEAYGTRNLLLAAREPRCLYAQWDLTPEQQQRYNALSADRHLVVRVYRGAIAGELAAEVHVHPESRHWFIHVARAETRYVAQLGYYRPKHQWVAISTSAPALTPPDTVSPDQTLRFATVPPHLRLTELATLAKQMIPADLPPLEAARERALAELVVLQAEWEGGVSSAEIALPGAEAESVSSPTGPPEQPQAGFWFNLDAELVIYGATEPDASVMIGGRPIEVRPDGTFSCRLALPDGQHSVVVSALSAQGDLRQAELHVSRRTEHRGEVGAAPQDPSLEPPANGL